ncbi:unnamed protein product, partial [Lampetra planeri]
ERLLSPPSLLDHVACWVHTVVQISQHSHKERERNKKCKQIITYSSCVVWRLEWKKTKSISSLQFIFF